MDIDEFNKKLNVTFRWKEVKNEFNEPILSCEGNFPHVDDRVRIKISSPLDLNDWQMLETLEAEDCKRILLERFIKPALELIPILKRETCA